MSAKDDVGAIRTIWRTRKAACTKAGAPASLFGSDDLGSALDTMEELIWIVEKGSKQAQDDKGKKALEKMAKDAATAAQKVGKTAQKYRDAAQKALDKAGTAALRDALRDALKTLTVLAKYDHLNADMLKTTDGPAVKAIIGPKG